jgi:hypothetical protein
MSMRFAVKDAEHSIITTDTGDTKHDLLNTALPWADMTYKFGNGDGLSGAAIFVHPEHFDYPPSWLAHHRGFLFVGWPGVKARTFEPDKPFSTSYRVFIHKKPLNRDRLQRNYDNYVEATKAAWR